MSDDDFSDLDDDPSLNRLIQQTRRPAQRTLDGNIIPTEYEEIPPVKQPKIHHPTHHNVDYKELATYIYPTNFEVRDYQFNIVQRAFYDNLLVALPTGLGKTFIASTVMLNFLRWFPDLKIIFMAPTKPLVAQQIKACCGITGIPASKTAILLDKTRRNRAEVWDSKQVFFTTPQVVENDLTSGVVDPKLVSLLVIDEAHRAKGNYAYNNVTQFIKRFSSSFRVLALTATPASDVEGVQEIINNLDISKVEVRTERSIDITRYMKRKVVERVTVGQSLAILDCIDLICPAIEPILALANDRGIYDVRDPLKINAFTALDASQRMARNPSVPEGLKWSNFFILLLLGVAGQCFRRLNIYGIKSFYSYFSEKHREFKAKQQAKKSTNQMAAKFYFHPNISKLLKLCEQLINDPTFLGHPKLEILISELSEFYRDPQTSRDSRVIIFTEFRESALDIVSSIERIGGPLKSHIFIGQAKEKEKFDETKLQKKGAKKKEKKADTTDNRTSTRTSSEDAQLKGMNQKMQKELIKKFKAGEYNILVATSIGEEGLDIGEVDLIICYDSTSSPIKNVQRMGRTGRKRDGKVLLLFAGNEELKFDKAMNGYEYIQLHIMNNNMIELHDQNRMIPKESTPTLVKKFIEIPPENIELKAEDDEDEIIRIATNYMNGTKSKGKAKKAPKAQKKIEKRFFMPEDVDTGFRSVTSMVRKKGKDQSVAESKNGASKTNEAENSFTEVGNISTGSAVLDDILSLDASQDLSDEDKGLTMQKEPITDPSLAVHLAANESDDSDPLSKSSATRTPVPKKLTVFRQQEVTSQFQNIAREKKAPLGIKEQKNLFSVPSLSSRLKKGTVGMPKKHPNVLDQLMRKKPAAKVVNSKETSFTISDEENDKDDEEHKNEANGVKYHQSDDNLDIFDDGLDDEILHMARQSSSLKSSQKEGPGISSQNIKSASANSQDEVYKNQFSPGEGLLNEDQQFDLYASYFTHVNPKDQAGFYDPSDAFLVKNGVVSMHRGGKIRHGKTALALHENVKRMEELDSREAEALLRQYSLNQGEEKELGVVVSDGE